MAVTLADLRTRARELADMAGAFVSDTGLDSAINVGWSQLYRLLVVTYEDFFQESTQIAVVSGTDSYDLSAIEPRLWKLRGVDLLLAQGDANGVPLRKFEWGERGRYLGYPDLNVRRYGSVLRYNLMGKSLKVVPSPQGGQYLKLWYIPSATKLVLALQAPPVDGEVLTLPSVVEPGWEEYIALVAATKMLGKEESDTGPFKAELAELRAEIVGSASDRDADAPPRMIRRSSEGGPGADDDPFGVW